MNERRSERLEAAIREAITQPGCDVVRAAAEAAQSWFLSVQLRTNPEFIQALIDADSFDWENRTTDTMESLKARLADLAEQGRCGFTLHNGAGDTYECQQRRHDGPHPRLRLKAALAGDPS